MRHPVINVIGYILTGLVVVGLAATVVLAALSNHPFYGKNYKGLPLGTYSTLAVMAVALFVGLAWLVRRAARLIKRD
jgi:uncharacterized membrane protein